MAESQVQNSQKTVKDRAIGLFQFLKEIVQIRSVVTRDLSEFIDVLWLHELPQQDGCYCAGWPQHQNADDNVWVEIKKQSLPKIPQPPESCAPWIHKESFQDPDGEPLLLETILNPKWQPRDNSQSDLLPIFNSEDEAEQVVQFLSIQDFPEIKSDWQVYVSGKWKPWAEEYKRRKAVQDIYSRLFSMYQQQKTLGESYEVVLGLGLLFWKTPKEQRVARHIISAQITLDFNPNQGTICVRPSIDGARLQFEQEMLEPDERPLLNVYLQLEDRLKEISNEVWHNEVMQSVLRSWVQALHSDGIYSEQWDEKREFGKAPKVSFSPALILRKRSTRGYIRFIEEILKQIANENRDVSPSVRMYLEIGESLQSQVNRSVYDNPDEPEEKSPDDYVLQDHEVYFPLPTNGEQREIIQRLGNHLGVLVQGPPGTGKSHTIANLICHLLASGKRVLVTSQTPRALKVLMGKLPPKIRPLCVNLLGRGIADVQSMESSVGEINSRYNTWNENQSKSMAKKLETQLYETKKRLQEVEYRMRELRETEVRKYSVADGAYQGTAQQIALRIATDEARLGWIQDDIQADSSQPCSIEEFARYLQLKRALSEQEVREIKKMRIPSQDIPATDTFVELIRNHEKATQKVNAVNNQLDIVHLIGTLRKLDRNKREKAVNLLNKFRVAKREVVKRPLPWLPEAVAQILGEQDQTLKELETYTRTLIEGLKDKAQIADDTNVKWPTGTDLVKLKADAEDLCGHLRKGGKLGWFVFRARVVKRGHYITKQIFVDGRPCERIELLGKLINHIEVETAICKLAEAWKTKIEPPAGTFFHRVAVYSENCNALAALKALEEIAKEVNEMMQQLEGVVPPRLNDEPEVDALFTALESVRANDELKEIDNELERILKKITRVCSSSDHHPVMDRLLEGLTNRNWNVWGEAHNALQEIEKKQREYETLLPLEEKLRLVIPNTLNDLIKSIHESQWDDKISLFDSAWKWARADAWLNDYSAQHDEYELQNDHKYQQKKLAQLKEDLAAEKAWMHCFSRMTEPQRLHLMAWSVAIKKLGKGTGKYAEKYRRDAEANLQECQTAIPAWIMPLYRVVDTVKPQEGIFDVVIVDEASQCGSEALLLQYIAKQCIIVGDDEQIAPEAVGVERNQVHLLIERFLKDVPIKESFDVENSLFTHAKIRYKNKIFLKEHFRCVPEIIQFSNNLCYAPHGASLIPLRQYPPDRLEPIKTVHVRSGFREGSGQDVINKPEAEELIKAVVACHKDKKYHKKTFGIISLQGHAQSKYIEKRLVEDLGPEVIEERGILCGEPYDFQGDERDVMFISMVAATNERIGTLTKETDKRRFNVAASRAADQVWLFHSVTLEDLNPIDLRYQLLNYYLNPQVQPVLLEGIDLEFLRKSNRNRNPPEPFDSWFEVDMYLKLTERGYRAIPQFRVAGYKIDLVVEGMRGRLAVECDGDEWHGPEMYDQDMARQRILERATWTFWRVRGSSFYRDPDQALEPLWQKLEELGIYPSGHKERKEAGSSKSETHAPPEDGSEFSETDATTSTVENLDVASESELDRFCQTQHNAKRLTPAIARAAVVKVLTIEPSKGKDLLPNDVIRLLGYTCRREDRRRLEKKIQRAMADLIRVGRLEEYATNKRKRIKLNTTKNREE